MMERGLRSSCAPRCQVDTGGVHAVTDDGGPVREEYAGQQYGPWEPRPWPEPAAEVVRAVRAKCCGRVVGPKEATAS
jgi:hypothetical protein